MPRSDPPMGRGELSLGEGGCFPAQVWLPWRMPTRGRGRDEVEVREAGQRRGGNPGPRTVPRQDDAPSDGLRQPPWGEEAAPVRTDPEADLRRVERALGTPVARLLGPFASAALAVIGGLGTFAPILVLLAILGVIEWATLGWIALVVVGLLVAILGVAALVLLIARRS